ncbi:MAG TPA: ABC transporter permease [Pyrinomonadaceae bacterium]|nr:ABC transporter permease [Pyrinomonadaceae bacterium]
MEDVDASPQTDVEIESPHAPALSRMPDKPVVLNEAVDSRASLSLRDLWAYRELLQFLVWRDIKVRYKQTAMGAAWAIIQPVTLVLTFAVFFGIFVGVPTEGMPFLIFYYCGLLPWTFFANSISTASMSLVGNSNLITKVYFPRIIIPAAAVGAGLIDLFIALLILVGMVLCYGIPITLNILMLPILILLTVLLAFGLGAWLAALTVKYRDIRHALPFILQLWMFLTPIIYPLNVVPEKWRWVMYINPLTGIVEGVRASLAGQQFNRPSLLLSAAVVIIILMCSAYSFRRTEKSFADLI